MQVCIHEYYLFRIRIMFLILSCDRGGDCECLCTSLSTFADECQKINIPVKWRTQDKCRKFL